jgi:hypothetical protein
MLKSRDGVRIKSSGSNLLSSFGPRVADVVAASGATVTLNCSRRAPIRDSFRPIGFPSSNLTRSLQASSSSPQRLGGGETSW